MKAAVGGATGVQPARVRFSEVMTGSISPLQPNSNLRFEGNTPLALHLTVNVADVRLFRADLDHTANLSGWVDCPALGGLLPVERGTCSFFPGGGIGLRYWLIFSDAEGRPFSLRGMKYIRTGAPGRVWLDTTTLYVRLLVGHHAAEEVNGEAGDAQGVVRIHPLAFAKQLTTFRSQGRSPGIRARALVEYVAFFIDGLWAAYTHRR